jgi:hypothetical protein
MPNAPAAAVTRQTGAAAAPKVQPATAQSVAAAQSAGHGPAQAQSGPVQSGPGQSGGVAQSGQAPPSPAPGRGAAANSLMSELKVSGHLMTLDSGLFCVVQTPAKVGDTGSGLPGVRLSLPPGAASRPDAVTISGFRPDGWLSASGDAALVRVSQGPAQLLVTIYQVPAGGEGSAPNIQVMRLLEWGAATSAPPRAPAPARAAEPAAAPAARGQVVMEMVAHIQERGDVGAMFGQWLGERGSKRWIEGFGLSPVHTIAAKDIEYQAVLGQGWLSPWVEGGQFCGSRAMALPLLGLRVRLRGAAAQTHDVIYSATFIDGSEVGPVMNGDACEAETLAALEAFQVMVQPHGASEPMADPAAARQPAMQRAPANVASEPEDAKRGGKPQRAKEPEPEPRGKASSGRKR